MSYLPKSENFTTKSFHMYDKSALRVNPWFPWSTSGVAEAIKNWVKKVSTYCLLLTQIMSDFQNSTYIL